MKRPYDNDNDNTNANNCYYFTIYVTILINLNDKPINKVQKAFNEVLKKIIDEPTEVLKLQKNMSISFSDYLDDGFFTAVSAYFAKKSR